MEIIIYYLTRNKMQNYTSNCYWFVYAGLRNSDEEFFKCADDLKLKRTNFQGKIDKESFRTAEAIMDVFSQEEKDHLCLELFDNEKQSQHVAFLDANGNFYDQNWPDWDLRLKKKLDNLLWEYKELFWTAYYMVHPLSFEEEKKVSQFINNLLE